MRVRLFFFILFFALFVSLSFSQSQSRIQGFGDAQAAGQYVNWIKQAIDHGRWSEALAASERAADFANVSSDIFYQLAFVRSHEGKNRTGIIEALDHAIEINRWEIYNENQALLLKSQQLIVMRKFLSALSILDNLPVSADSACLRLLSFKGMAFSKDAAPYDPAAALNNFRRLMLSSLDRFPHDPRMARIFFEYARNRQNIHLELEQSDFDLLELVLRRLPFLLETDTELAWMAASFMRDAEDARRLLAAYRAGGLPSIYNRDFMPNPGSIPAALNLGLIDDTDAVKELFSGVRGINSPHPVGIKGNGDPVIDLEIITKVYSLLRSDEGRDLFTQKLLDFCGCIFSDNDYDGNVDTVTYYRYGVIHEFTQDKDHDNEADLQITFLTGIPVSAVYLLPGQASYTEVIWERYPSVEKAVFAQERFTFRPADLQFQPVSFITLGGSLQHSGVNYPVPSYQLDLTRRTLISFCESVTRPSVEFDGAFEKIFFERGFPVQAVEIMDGQYVSVTTFEKGIPVMQYIDLDADGRMETIRKFHRPGQNYPWPDPGEIYDYHRLIASSESDWTGEGRYKTGEIYMQDGTVIYLWDIDGSGNMNYSEVKSGNR